MPDQPTPPQSAELLDKTKCLILFIENRVRGVACGLINSGVLTTFPLTTERYSVSDVKYDSNMERFQVGAETV
ncbi:hypothetical protein HF325_006392 [Metschnikowia pulcherrima]|uniref:Uncharacterized protein n=1 Tax=Metschnikowia pulcherrima TaxID=27326 RepID=A0A8H7L920_9ASCO|nr:hypothetical protein HF325_006392 [Metschnikowia pulcherrima]